ncbi:unnamed protein product, partial [Hapterophycus canaliculatus]
MSWDTRSFGPQEPLETTLCQPASIPGSLHRQDGADRRLSGAPATGAPAASFTTVSQQQKQHQSPPRFTVRPPSRSFDGRFTLRQCSPPVPDWHGNVVTSSSAFDFSSSSNSGVARGESGLQPCSGSDSDASTDAEVASLTHGRRLGTGAEGLLRMVSAPSRSRRGEPRIRDAESAVALFALLSPSTQITSSPDQDDLQKKHGSGGDDCRVSSWGAETAA